MKEIQAIDLQPGKMYYIESTFTSSLTDKTRRQKGIFEKYLPADDEDDNFNYAHFENVENINPNDPCGVNITGTLIYTNRDGPNAPRVPLYIPGRMFYNMDYYTFYLCQTEEIRERKEREAVNSLLEQITGDPLFVYQQNRTPL